MLAVQCLCYFIISRRVSGSRTGVRRYFDQRYFTPGIFIQISKYCTILWHPGPTWHFLSVLILFCWSDAIFKTVESMYVFVSLKHIPLIFAIPWWRHQMENSALLGNPPFTGGSPHKGRRCRALMFTLICAWTNDWANNRDAVDLRRHRANYDVAVMTIFVLFNNFAVRILITHRCVMIFRLRWYFLSGILTPISKYLAIRYFYLRE